MHPERSSATSPSARTPPRSAPETARASWPPCGTWSSPSWKGPALGTSPPPAGTTPATPPEHWPRRTHPAMTETDTTPLCRGPGGCWQRMWASRCTTMRFWPAGRHHGGDDGDAWLGGSAYPQPAASGYGVPLTRSFRFAPGPAAAWLAAPGPAGV